MRFRSPPPSTIRNPWAPTGGEAAFLALAAACLLGWLLFPSDGAPGASWGLRADFVHSIDVLHAGPNELALLPGIGPSRAARIVRSRAQPDPPADPALLLKEAGLSEPEIREIRPWFRAIHE